MEKETRAERMRRLISLEPYDRIISIINEEKEKFIKVSMCNPDTILVSRDYYDILKKYCYSKFSSAIYPVTEILGLRIKIVKFGVLSLFDKDYRLNNNLNFMLVKDDN